MQVKITKNGVGFIIAAALILGISACIPTGGGGTGDITIAYRVINSSVTASGTTIGVGNMKTVDLDNNGTADLEMTAFYSYFAGKSYKGINGTTLFVAADTAVFFAANQLISNSSTLSIDNTVYSNATETGFIGYSLPLPDGIHFGWFKASGQFTDLSPLVKVTASVNHTGYKKSPDTPIPAGKH